MNMQNKRYGPLGHETQYPTSYDPQLLFPIARHTQRQQLHMSASLSMYGYDTWNAYELSWLNTKGKPMVAIARFDFTADSPNLIESKSFKLYLNSFNHHRLDDMTTLQQVLTKDLTAASGQPVIVTLFPLEALVNTPLCQFTGQCLDPLDVDGDQATVDATLLRCDGESLITETLFSNLLKSNCPVTGQPDWGSVLIHYHGKQIDHHRLLQYIISYRHHQEFHEHCVENIFVDIINQCQPQSLTVEARYTRRGGLDINPIRSTEDNIQPADNRRLIRQ